MISLQKRQKKKQGKCCYSRFIARVIEYLTAPVPLVNNKTHQNVVIPKWRNITAIQKLAYCMHYMDTEGFFAITLDFSDEFRKKFGWQIYRILKDTIRRRINANLKNILGYIPPYAFIIEGKNLFLHVHGIIKIPKHQMKELEHALKTTAFGARYNKTKMREHILKMEALYHPRGWFGYMMKNPQTGAASLFISQELRRDIKNNYQKTLSIRNLKE